MAGKKLLHDPRDIHIADSKNNELSKQEREDMYSLVFRRWPPFLSGSEIKIVLFVYDRTIAYNRRWSYITIDTLHRGYPLRDYRNTVSNLYSDPKFYRSLSAQERAYIDEGNMFLTAPTGLSRRQVMRSLDSLEKRGFIFRIRNGEQPEIALNPDAHYGYMDFILNHKAGK